MHINIHININVDTTHGISINICFLQVAFLAPTRVLALQHLRVLRTRMPDINIQLLRGGGKGDALKVKEMIKNGECEVHILLL